MYENLAPIIIEAAMESEISVILQALSDREDTELYGYPVVKGTLHGYPVIAARTKIGMISAATLTLALAEKLHPLCIISEGTAGAHLTSLHAGDIIIGEKIVNINTLHMKPEDVRSMEHLALGEWFEQRSFESDSRLTQLALSVPYSGGKLLCGTIGSGDFWSHAEDEIHACVERFGTSCEEMETFAEAQICAMTHIPFLALRVISNNELIGESFDEATVVKCQQYTLDVAAAIIEKYR